MKGIIMKYSILLLTLCVFSVYPMNFDLMRIKIGFFNRPKRSQVKNNSSGKSPVNNNNQKSSHNTNQQKPYEEKQN